MVDLYIDGTSLEKESLTINMENRKGGYTFEAITCEAFELSLSGLVNDTDYSVAYANNVNAGTATATITGKGKYVGSFTINFTILPAKMTGIEAMDITNIYTGEKQVMSLSKYPQGATVTYSRVQNGKYTRQVPVMRNVGKQILYYGEKRLTFVVNPKRTTIRTIRTLGRTATIKWIKVASQTTGYQLQINTNSNFRNKKTYTIKDKNNTKAVIRKFTAGKKYYVRIRTYKVVSGKKYISKWSTIKTFRIR